MLIIGLGNPTKTYENTYHNIGFMVVDAVAEKLSLKFKDKECSSFTAKKYNGEEKIILAKPQTYMNLSGDAVKQLMGKYKCEPKDFLIIFDDLDLPLASIRIRRSGSAGTHNGMRHIIECLGSGDFPRIRLGIGKDLDIPLVNYVTSRMNLADAEKLRLAVQAAADAVIEYIESRDIEAVARKYNALQKNIL